MRGAVELGVAVDGADEPRFKLGGWKEDAVVEEVGKEVTEKGGVKRLDVGKVGDGGGARKQSKHGAHTVDAGAAQCVSKAGGFGFEVGVEVWFGEEVEGGEACGHGDGIAGEGSGLVDVAEGVEVFHDVGAAVYGISVDSQYTHLAWTNTPRNAGGIQGLKYPLLADLCKKTAADYGVLKDGVALRGLFIIDPDGVVQQATINNLSVGRSVDETLRLVKAFQFVREHGEVCPANWQPGADTMKPDPTGSKEWFGKNAK